MAFILEQDAVLKQFFLSIESPLQHPASTEPLVRFCGLLDATENSGWIPRNGDDFCVGKSFDQLGQIGLKGWAFFAAVNGLLAVGEASVKILGRIKMCGGILGLGWESVTAEEFCPSVGVFQPFLAEKQTLWQVVTLEFRFIHQRDCGMLVQAGVKHRCAGAEDACDEEILGSLAGGHAGKRCAIFGR